MNKILIVDDQEDNLKAYSLAISDANLDLEIKIAHNVDEAKTEIYSTEFDIILTDLVMADIDSGMQILKISKEKNPLTIVIMITAYDDKLQRYNAFEMGAFDCITKGTPGVKTAVEIVVKLKAALSYRKLVLDQIEGQKKIDFLKRYFDPRIFSQIEKNPDLLSIQSKTVTIVFWDIRGFSKLSEILKAYPTLISSFLKEYFQIASKVIFSHQGVLDKFIGDGVMALFGAINGKDKDGKEYARHAVEAAIELKKEFQTLYSSWLKQWTLYTPNKIDIGLGCGIHTGEVLVGNVGTEERDHFTALGPNVNFTQRIESRAGKEQILISTSTRARINSSFHLKLVDTINDVKNIPGEFEIYEVLD